MAVKTVSAGSVENQILELARSTTAFVDAPEPTCAPAAPDDDQALVEAFRAGDVAAFETLYSRHHSVVLRRLTRLCGNAAVAEELTQETFLRAAQRIGSGGDLRFRAWVMRIGTNLGIDHLRALRRAPLMTMDPTMLLEPRQEDRHVVDTEVQAEMREELRFVSRVLDTLTPRHRAVLILREVEGLDYRSIAERLGVTSAAVETLLFRARGSFRREYAKAMAA